MDPIISKFQIQTLIHNGTLLPLDLWDLLRMIPFSLELRVSHCYDYLSCDLVVTSLRTMYY